MNDSVPEWEVVLDEMRIAIDGDMSLSPTAVSLHARMIAPDPFRRFDADQFEIRVSIFIHEMADNMVGENVHETY